MVLGSQIDLTILEQTFRDLPGARVTVEPTPEGGQRYLLQSTEFDGLEDAREVSAVGTQLLAKMHGALKLETDADKVMPAGLAYHHRPDGLRDVIAITPTLQFRLRGIAAQGVVQGQMRQQSLQERVIALCEHDQNVSDALEHYSHSNDWFDIYKVLEVIRDDLGSRDAIAGKNWVTRAELISLWTTANYYRHARIRRPDQLITHQQAFDLLRAILGRWIDAKLA